MKVAVLMEAPGRPMSYHDCNNGNAKPLRASEILSLLSNDGRIEGRREKKSDASQRLMVGRG
jgi:hypothetical protein